MVVDCQATAAAPRGCLLEIGWASGLGNVAHAHARLIALPDGERVPPAVARITGISDRLAGDGVPAALAWRELTDEAARLSLQPAPTLIHYARFERPFLHRLAGGPPPLDIVCTHEIARRLLPDLPRRSLRALAGYFGRAVGSLRRSADHVEATAFVWGELTGVLASQGVSTWGSLRDWLAAPRSTRRPARRVWPMPRALRLALPDAPGVYRMLRTSGDVLYVGKAASLHHRVNSYFRKQHGVHERMLEMLSQARGIAFDIAPSALEAALVESDEIKRHRPPYNVALTAGDRAVWFAARDLSARNPHPSARCCLGPFPSAELLDQFAAMARANRAALARGRWGPDADVFDAGYADLCGAHPEMAAVEPDAHVRLLRLGTRLWREGQRDRQTADDETRAEAWTPETVRAGLERLVLRAALARRRAIWLTRLVDAAFVWTEPGSTTARLLVIERGEIVVGADCAAGAEPPVPPGGRRPRDARHAAFTVAILDRLRILTTEMKRLAAAHAAMSLRLGTEPAQAGESLAAALGWV